MIGRILCFLGVPHKLTYTVIGGEVVEVCERCRAPSTRWLVRRMIQAARV